MSLKPSRLNTFLLAISGSLYLYLGYSIERYQSFVLIGLYALLFSIFIYVFRKNQFSAKQIILTALILRLLFLFSMPVLSDDIYRFIWDGKLIHEGIHPFAHVPSWFIENGQLPKSLSIELYRNLNSPDYFTIYPPLA
ncbi:MAG: mannosyltransferase, partial [Bacteroidota bacterium]